VAQLVERSNLDFSLDHDLRVMGSSTASVSMLSMESAGNSFLLPLHPPLGFVFFCFLISKYTHKNIYFKKYNIVVLSSKGLPFLR